MTPRTLYLIKQACRVNLGIRFTDSELEETFINHLKSQGVVIGESE